MLRLDFVDILLCDFTAFATMVVAQSGSGARREPCDRKSPRQAIIFLTFGDRLLRSTRSHKSWVYGRYRRHRILLHWPKRQKQAEISDFHPCCRVWLYRPQHRPPTTANQLRRHSPRPRLRNIAWGSSTTLSGLPDPEVLPGAPRLPFCPSVGFGATPGACMGPAQPRSCMVR